MKWRMRQQVAFCTATKPPSHKRFTLIFFVFYKKIHLIQVAISCNCFLKISKQTAKWGSGFIKKRKKNILPPVLRGQYWGKYFSLSCTLGNIFVLGIILGKFSHNSYSLVLFILHHLLFSLSYLFCTIFIIFDKFF